MNLIAISLLALTCLVGSAGCVSEPQQDVEAAQIALSRAGSAEAGVYAAATYAAALDSFAAASVEIETQNGASVFSRDYDSASRLLAATIETAQEAEAEAVDAKFGIEAEADSLIARAQQALAAAPQAVEPAGTENASSLIDDAVEAQQLGDPLTARDLARQALKQLVTPPDEPAAPRS